VARRAVATDRMGGGGSSGRWKTAGLTDRVGPSISEGGGDGPTGPEMEGGGRAETVARAEIQKSKKKINFN
jgi:hypothetical protein